MPKKKLNLKLVGKNGNAYNLLAYFKKEAKRAGWTQKQIDKTTTEAMSGDYDNLLYILGRV